MAGSFLGNAVKITAAHYITLYPGAARA